MFRFPVFSFRFSVRKKFALALNSTIDDNKIQYKKSFCVIC
jgi:hypothetical protein